MVSLQHSGHMNLKGGTPLSDASRLPLQPPELAALGTSSSAHPSGSALLAESARFKACFTAELMPDIGRLQYWGPTSNGGGCLEFLEHVASVMCPSMHLQ